MAFIPRIGPSRGKLASFPSVVVESGWQESTTRHLDDARLWLEGSGNAVRVVLQAKFHEANESGRIHFVLSVSRAHPDEVGCTISSTYYVSFIPLPHVQTLVFFINLGILNVGYFSDPPACHPKPYHLVR